MKKLVLILFLIITPFIFLKGQTNQYYQQEEYYETEQYIDWKLSNPGNYGIPSFFWFVSRSKFKINGQYIFDIWFYSNSYIWDYFNGVSVWKSTYVDGIYVIVDDQYINKESVWVTFQDKFTFKGLRFYRTHKYPEVKLIYNRVLIP